MFPFLIRVEAVVWIVWIVTWNIAAIWRSRPTSVALRGTYRLLFAMIALGMVLIFNAIPQLSYPLWGITPPALGWSIVGVSIAGIAFAWWARFALGKLWSGGIERMADHRVVDTGPYALARHPIYTGLIAASLSATVIRGTPWALAGAVLFSLGFILKARVEERFLEKEFGGYDDYRRRVRMIVPLPRF